MTLRRSAWSATLVFLLAAAPPAQPDATPPLELDIVISTNLQTTAEHVADFRGELRKAAGKALGSLKPRIYGDDQKPADGAARFRLLIEHRGVVLIDDRPLASRASGPDQDTINWELDTGQEGQITFRFLRWESGKYRPLGGWSIPAGEQAPGGRVTFATQSVPPGAPPPAQPPVPFAEARAKALERLKPRDIEQPLLAGLLRVELLRAGIVEAGDPPRGAAEVGLVNLSPWPLEKVRLSVEWEADPQTAFRVIFEHKFDKPLSPRQPARIGGDGWTGRASPGRLKPPAAISAQFAPAPVPPAAKPK